MDRARRVAAAVAPAGARLTSTWGRVSVGEKKGALRETHVRGGEPSHHQGCALQPPPVQVYASHTMQRATRLVGGREASTAAPMPAAKKKRTRAPLPAQQPASRLMHTPSRRRTSLVWSSGLSHGLRTAFRSSSDPPFSLSQLFTFGGSAAPTPPAAVPTPAAVVPAPTPTSWAPTSAVVAAAAVRRVPPAAAPAAKPAATPHATPKKRVLRAPSAYNLFVADAAAGARSLEQGAAAFKGAAARWKAMGAAEKARWHAAAAAEKAKFLAAHPPAPKAPARAPSAYQLFVKERLGGVPATVPPRERMARVGAEWRALPAGAKAPYLARAAAAAR